MSPLPSSAWARIQYVCGRVHSLLHPLLRMFSFQLFIPVPECQIYLGMKKHLSTHCPHSVPNLRLITSFLFLLLQHKLPFPLKLFFLGSSLLLNSLCAYMLSHFSHVQLFSTPWSVAHQAPRSMGFSRQEYWSGLPCPPPGDLPDPGMGPTSLMSPALGGEFFTASATWEAELFLSTR